MLVKFLDYRAMKGVGKVLNILARHLGHIALQMRDFSFGAV